MPVVFEITDYFWDSTRGLLVYGQALIERHVQGRDNPCAWLGMIMFAYEYLLSSLLYNDRMHLLIHGLLKNNSDRDRKSDTTQEGVAPHRKT